MGCASSLDCKTPEGRHGVFLVTIVTLRPVMLPTSSVSSVGLLVSSWPDFHEGSIKIRARKARFRKVKWLTKVKKLINGRACMTSRTSHKVYFYFCATVLGYLMTPVIGCLEPVKSSCNEENVARDTFGEAHGSATWDREASSLMLTISNVVMWILSLATAPPPPALCLFSIFHL